MKQFSIINQVNTYGIKNIRIFGPGDITSIIFPYTTIPVDMMEFKICEESQKMSPFGKFRMSPVKDDKNKMYIGNPVSTYVRDFEMGCENGTYRVYAVTSDGYELISPFKCNLENQTKIFLSKIFSKLKMVL